MVSGPMTGFTESIVEEVACAWLESLGWSVIHRTDIAPDTPAERTDPVSSSATVDEQPGGCDRRPPGLRGCLQYGGAHDRFTELTQHDDARRLA